RPEQATAGRSRGCSEAVARSQPYGPRFQSCAPFYRKMGRVTLPGGTAARPAVGPEAGARRAASMRPRRGVDHQVRLPMPHAKIDTMAPPFGDTHTGEPHDAQIH